MNVYVMGKNIFMKSLSLGFFFVLLTLWGLTIIPEHQDHIAHAQPIVCFSQLNSVMSFLSLNTIFSHVLFPYSLWLHPVDRKRFSVEKP